MVAAFSNCAQVVTKHRCHVCLELEVGEGGPGSGDPAGQVQNHGQVGEGRRQQRPGVEELDSQVEASVPTTFALHISNQDVFMKNYL